VLISICRCGNLLILTVMATKKAAESTLYHLSPKGFWKKFRDAVVVNPEISSGLPIAGINRYPQPASRPERYTTPATKASDIAENPYWKRDVRRAYPQLSVITQSDLSTFLLQRPEDQTISAPSGDNGADKPFVPTAPREALDLTAAITKVTSERKVYSESKLPPVVPIPFKRWQATLAEEAPHDPNAYFPMLLYK